MLDPNNNLQIDTIVTDLEPDDYIALTILNRYKKLTPSTNIVVVGWSDVQHKARTLRYFLSTVAPDIYNSINVYTGDPSNFDFNYNIDIPADFNNEMFTEADSSVYVNKTILCLAKPPTNLIKSDVSNTTIYFYASANFRSFINLNNKVRTDKRRQQNIDILMVFLKRCKQCYVYESFGAIGPKNSVDDPQIMELIRTNYPMVYRFMELWNKEIMRDCYDTIQALIIVVLKRIHTNLSDAQQWEVMHKLSKKSNPEPNTHEYIPIDDISLQWLTEEEKTVYERNFKCYNACKKPQFVNADGGLVITLLLSDYWYNTVVDDSKTIVGYNTDTLYPIVETATPDTCVSIIKMDGKSVDGVKPLYDLQLECYKEVFAK